MSGIRINEIGAPTSALDGNFDLVHVYQKVGSTFRSVAVPLSSVAFQGPSGQDGSPGSTGVDGASGKSVAQLVVYRYLPPGLTTQEEEYYRPGAVNAAGTVNDGGKYNFTTRFFTIPLGGWSGGVPAEGVNQSGFKLYSCNGVAQIVGSEGEDTNIEWTKPETTGIQGQAGAPGTSTYQAVIFKRSATPPTPPTGGEFNFLTDTLTPPTGWYRDTSGPLGPLDANGNEAADNIQLWMTNQQFSITADPSDETTNPATGRPFCVAVGGVWGGGSGGSVTRFAQDGADGVSTFAGAIYKRDNTTTVPPTPGNSDTTLGGYYDFRANTFVLPTPTNENQMAGWSLDVPNEDPLDRQALWESRTVASVQTDFLGSGDVWDQDLTWSTPRKVVQPAVDGNKGNIVSQVRCYRRAVGSAPATPTGGEFDFDNKIVTAPTDWSNEPIQSTLATDHVDYAYDFLYVSVGVATSVANADGTYNSDTNILWGSPIISSESGLDAVSTYMAQIYTRYGGSVDIETLTYAPTGGSYNFGTNTLTLTDASAGGSFGERSGNNLNLTWYDDIPAGTATIYRSQNQFSITGNVGAPNGSSNWTVPKAMAYNGTAGINATTNTTMSLYYGADNEIGSGSVPDFPTDINCHVNLDPNSTDFATIFKSTTNGTDANLDSSGQILSANPSGPQGTGWFTAIPDKDWVYITQAGAQDPGSTTLKDTISGSKWSETVPYLKPGGNGLAGLATYLLPLYKRTASANTPTPSKPTGPVRYYFMATSSNSRGDVVVPGGTTLNGWLSSPPDFDGTNHYLWRIDSTATSRVSSDLVADTEWDTPYIFSQNPFNLTEITANYKVYAYKRTGDVSTIGDPGTVQVYLSGNQAGQIETAPLANNWSADPPAGSQQMYVTVGTAIGIPTSLTDTDTIQNTEWSTPVPFGVKGDQGLQGLPGGVSQQITLFKRTDFTPAAGETDLPTVSGEYNFEDDTWSFGTHNSNGQAGTGNNWSFNLPAKDTTDHLLWQTFAQAISSQNSAQYTILPSKWRTPLVSSQDGFLTPIYAEDASGLNASITQSGTKTFVHFHQGQITADNQIAALGSLTYFNTKGDTGTAGTQGANGSSVQIVYSTTSNGAAVSLAPNPGYDYVLYDEYNGATPALHTYLAANANPDKVFVKFKGEDAINIVPVYATSSSGANSNLNPQTGSTHVSFIEDTIGTLSTDFATTWPDLSANQTFVKIRGEDGSSISIKDTLASTNDLPSASSATAGDAYIISGNLWVFNGTSFTDVGQVQGPQGETGNDGAPTYIHVKYANIVDGIYVLTGQDGEAPDGDYLGVTTSTSPTDPSLSDNATGAPYSWTKVTANPRYTHIAYANDINGSTDFYTGTDPGARKYIGISVDNISSTESTDPNKYTWSKIVGEDGQAGAQGNPGADGQSLYTWIKYAYRSLTGNDSASDMTDSPVGQKYIGIALNKTSDSEGGNPGDYTWSLIQGTGRPNGFEGYKTSAMSQGAYTGSTLTYVSDDDDANGDGNYLQLTRPSINDRLGIAYPAVDISDVPVGQAAVQFDVRYRLPAGQSTQSNDRIYILAVTDGELAAGKNAIGYSGGGSSALSDPEVHTGGTQLAAMKRTGDAGYQDGNDYTYFQEAVEAGPGYKKTTFVVKRSTLSQKFVSVNILLWGSIGRTNAIQVKEVVPRLVGVDGTDGSDGTSTFKAEIYKQTSITENSTSGTTDIWAYDLDASEGANDDGVLSPLTTVTDGWQTTPPAAVAGKRIFRQVYNIEVPAGTTGTVNILQSNWSSPIAFSESGGRTAPVVAQTAAYRHFNYDYTTIKNTALPDQDLYSFRQSGRDVNAVGVDADEIVNYGYGNPTAQAKAINTIKQILFTLKGTDGVDYTNFWKSLDTAPEFIWKQGASWILFRRTSATDYSGQYSMVMVDVVDHSDDITTVGDLGGYSSSSSTNPAGQAKSAIFGYTPSNNSRTVYLHQRHNNSTVPPALPSGNATYIFESNAFQNSAYLNNWSIIPPAVNAAKPYLWRIQATALGKIDTTSGTLLNTDVILQSEWANTAHVIAQDGIDGVAGSTVFVKFLYRRDTVSTPVWTQNNNWNASSPYRPEEMQVMFREEDGETVSRVRTSYAIGGTNDALTDSTYGTWYEDIPPESDGEFLFVTTAPVNGQASSDFNHDIVLKKSWSLPVQLTKDGVGTQSQVVQVYRRSAGSLPSGTSQNVNSTNPLGFSYDAGTPNSEQTQTVKYEFASGLFTDSYSAGGINLNGWSLTIPSNAGGSTLWVSRAVASSTTNFDNIPWSEWDPPQEFVSDGPGLRYQGAFANRATYIAHINSTTAYRVDPADASSGIPPVNAYHIETTYDPTLNGGTGAVETRNVSYLYTGGQGAAHTNDKNIPTNFERLSVDGPRGVDGSFVWKGIVATVSAIPDGAPDGNVYKVSADGKFYIIEAGSPQVMVEDGAQGPGGAAGPDGKQIFIIHSTNSLTDKPSPPANSSVGNSAPWTNVVLETAKYNWMSIKVARAPSAANSDYNSVAWSPAMLIGGEKGEAGYETFNIKIWRRSETRPATPPSSGQNSGAFFFGNNDPSNSTYQRHRLLPPYGWSHKAINTGIKGLDFDDNTGNGITAPSHPADGEGWEWKWTGWTAGNGGYTEAKRKNPTNWEVKSVDNTASVVLSDGTLSSTGNLPLWSCEATVTINAGTTGTTENRLDTDISWTRPTLEQLNGFDFKDDTIDVDKIFGVVKNAGGVSKIQALDYQTTPQLITQAAFDALALPATTNENKTTRAQYGWRNGDVGAPDYGITDSIQDDTFYLIF